MLKNEVERLLASRGEFSSGARSSNYAVANIGKRDGHNVCQIGLRLLSYPGEYNVVS